MIVLFKEVKNMKLNREMVSWAIFSGILLLFAVGVMPATALTDQ